MSADCARLIFSTAQQASRLGGSRIQIDMKLIGQALRCKRFFLLSAAFFFVTMFIAETSLRAQATQQGPIAPPPEDHHVSRIGNEAEPTAPPSLAEAEIIKRFSQKEDTYLLERTHYTYRKTVRIQEFDSEGKPAGEFLLVTEPTRDMEGKLFEKVVERPKSTLQHLYLRSEDLEGLQKTPAYPLTTTQLAKYDLKYLGKEQVDEIDCYIFQAKAKVVDRTKAYFDGVVWVDAKYLEVVKTYGKWVTDQGDMKTVGDLPFTLFETYRENVDGKYWFPSYSRADATLNLKGLEIPVRVVVKWTDFKPANSPPIPPAAQTQAAPAKP
jgi:hypothetical protein